jgi:hypothetical protein
MKNLVLLAAIVFSTANGSLAQQNGKIHHLMVSIHFGSNAFHPQIIVTKDDGSQEVTNSDKIGWIRTSRTMDIRKGKMAANEDSLFFTLKTFYDAGWVLVSSSSLKIGMDDDYLSRYFFIKQD